MVAGGCPLLSEILTKTDPPPSKIRILIDFTFTAAAHSAVTPGKKIQLTQIGNPVRAFQSAYDE